MITFMTAIFVICNIGAPCDEAHNSKILFTRGDVELRYCNKYASDKNIQAQALAQFKVTVPILKNNEEVKVLCVGAWNQKG